MNKLIRLLLFALLLTTQIVFAQSKQEYAAFLMKDRDYFRAISEYKELAFYSKSSDSIIFYSSQIGRAYRFSGKFELSNETFGWLVHDFKLSPSAKSRAMLNLGFNYLSLNDTIKAYKYFTGAAAEDSTSPAYLLLGLYYCKTGNWEKVESAYTRAKKTMADKSFFDSVKELGETIQSARGISSRSPFAATALSVVLPGAGQIYCGHYADGIQALTFVSAFAYMSYIANRYDVEHGKARARTYISLSLTSMFYIANLFGAGRTAEYYNQKQNAELFDGINSVVGRLNF